MSESPLSHAQKRKLRRRRLNRKSVSETDGIDENEELLDGNSCPDNEQEADTPSDDELTWYINWGLQKTGNIPKKSSVPPKLTKTKSKKDTPIDNQKNRAVKNCKPNGTLGKEESARGRNEGFPSPSNDGAGSKYQPGNESNCNINGQGWSDMTSVMRTLRTLKCSSMPNLDSLSPTIDHKISKLVPGKTYTGIIESSRRHHFIVTVGGSVKVLVFTARFQPRGSMTTLGPEVMASSILKTGDTVSLKAVPNKTTSANDLQWVAQKCWQEDTASPMKEFSSPLNLQPVQMAVVQVSSEAVLFADGVCALADSIFLFGFRLAHPRLDLTDIFERGHLMWYVLSPSRAASSGPKVADLAWFGSLPAGKGNEVSLKQQYQVFKFVYGRPGQRLSTSEVMSVVNLLMGQYCVEGYQQ